MKPFTSLEKISFDAHGATIERAMSAHAKACDAADLRRDGVVTKELNMFLDRVRSIPGAETSALTKAARAAIKSDAHITGLVEGGALSRATLAAYLTGVTRAMAHGVPWTPGLHKDPQYAGAERKAAPVAKAPTDGAAIKWSGKDRTLSATLPKAVDGAAVAKAMAVIVNDPGRVALFLSWVNAHQDWTK